MGSTLPLETYPGKVNEVTIGSQKIVSIGGENTLPFHSFEGNVPNKPVIAYEIQDVPPDDWHETLLSAYGDVTKDPVKWAQYCEQTLKADAIAIRLVGTHPDNQNKSPEHAAQVVRDVLSGITIPLIILGSNSIEKDAQVLVSASNAAKGYNCAIGKAQEGNYKTIVAAALANNHNLIAMSELDVNLSKQLNILITQMGFDKERIIIDPMCSALGYGLEYSFSVMERIRLAALTQNDVVVQQPMLGDVGMYVWKVKEAQALQSDMPRWGDQRMRGILWEAVTAATLMLSGAELLIMRHPDAVEKIKSFIDDLI
ncbi:MAG: acetyl-CoA decarbonylase/synthase complex subunit delta [Thermodesulfovibrionales bacterium]|nr:acetyl-CoA decarbonylase/synthase complex subunit delta [Thermodesulfovibrionales bacterium]